ncbi:MAG: hypothetical protein AB7I27_16635 [Bacteriovoracaceae bacterium]
MKKLLLFILCTFPWATRATSYSMADLESLVKERSFEEFFNHALDIRPSERQEAWKSMASKMGDAYTKSLLSKSEIEKKDFRKIEELYQWPSLKSDDVFKARRQEIGLRYLKSCLKSESPCWNEVKSFWESDQSDAELGFQLASLTSTYSDSPLPLWNFLEIALKGNASEFYCKKEFVMAQVWQKLGLDYIRLGSEGDFLKKIDQTLHPDCLPSLNLEAMRRLMNPSGPTDREVGFQILKSQGKMNQKLTDFFYTVYLLERPSQGELFNYAWNRVKELGASSLRRDEVLTLIKKLDPLPDDLLTSLDSAKKRAIYTHFKQNFPEYLDYYTGQCLTFYEGKTIFPKGNPTVHCQDLMNSDIGLKVVDEFKIKKFQQIRKI